MFDLAQVQSLIRESGLDGWLLYDFRHNNVLATRVLGIPDDTVASRRWFYFVPAEGEPKKLVHRIEMDSLDHVPGSKRVYLRWQELEAELQSMLQGSQRVAMEYSPRNANPYVSRVDAGTIELVKSFGVEITSSGDLIQAFEARWTDEQWQLHLQANDLNMQAFRLAWKMIADHARENKPLRETEVQNAVMQFYHDNHMTTYHPPIVGFGPNSGNPHYAPEPGSDAQLKENDFVLLDMWVKMDVPRAVYSDVTKVGYVGETVPDEYQQLFAIVARARDASVDLVKQAFAEGRPLQGWEVDQAARDVIEAAGYGDCFYHRTGHNIGQETHGNGAHIDNLETKEERSIMKGTCFSIEPGIYRDDLGIRCEVNVFVDDQGEVHVTGEPQREVLPILKAF